MDYKKLLKYAGKTAATIACPPLGLALWMKKYKGLAATVGIVLSFALNSGQVMSNLVSKKIYDNPEIKISYFPKDFSGYYDNVPRVILEAFTSPLAFYFDNRTGGNTYLGEHSIAGKDAITFNNGKYQLNFSEDRKFNLGDGQGYFSVKEAQENVCKYKDILEYYRQKGDIFSARRARESLGKANLDLEKVTASYRTVKSEFRIVVDKMNSELEGNSGLENVTSKKEAWEL